VTKDYNAARPYTGVNLNSETQLNSESNQNFATTANETNTFGQAKGSFPTGSEMLGHEATQTYLHARQPSVLVKRHRIEISADCTND